MIGGPLNAVVKAQAQSAQTSVDFIKSIGFNAPDAANDPASRQVSAIYRSEAPAFIDAYIAWLEQTERELAGLRAPVSILLQAEKSLLTAVLDGSVPAVLNSEKSVRKRQRAVAAQSLERISKEIQTKMRKH